MTEPMEKLTALHPEYEGVIEMIYARRMRHKLATGRFPRKILLAPDLWDRWTRFLVDEGHAPGAVFGDMEVGRGAYLERRTLRVGE